MSDSALAEVETRRQAQRRETSTRIAHHARLLAEQHGIDGFTVDQLAQVAGVSRRTLFNYYPSKYEAILGDHPAPTDHEREVFRSGGPTGDLVQDILAVLRSVVSRIECDRFDAAATQRLMRANPRLLAIATEQLDLLIDQLTDEVRIRLGADYDAQQARTWLAVLVAVCNVALADRIDAAEGHTHESFVAAIDRHLDHARALFR